MYSFYFQNEFLGVLSGGTVFKYNRFESKSGVISVICEKGVIFRLLFNISLIASSANNSQHIQLFKKVNSFGLPIGFEIIGK
jgi:hypothetical protein